MRRWYGKEQFPLKTLDKNYDGSFTVQSSTGIFKVQQAKHGKGCFSQTNFPAQTFLGVYPGRIVNEKQLGVMLSKMKEDQQTTLNQYLVQSKLHSTEKSNCYLCPVNEHGKLDLTWSDNYALYINEPDVGQSSNVHPVWNLDKDRLELWSSKPIQAGQELLISYGSSYHRNYAANVSVAETWIMKNGKLEPSADF